MGNIDFVQITRRDSIPEQEFFAMVNGMYEEIWSGLFPPQILTDGMANYVRNNVITPPDAPVPDCETCGACCKTFVCVGVRPSDNLDPSRYWDITKTGENGDYVVDRYLRRDGETLACASLSGTIGERVACTIYESRPAMCRHFEAGSDRCHILRRAFGLEPFLTMMEMYEARQKLDAKVAPALPSERIKGAKITDQPGTEELVINALMTDGKTLSIHTFDPRVETWMQFEFDGLRMAEAQALIDERKRRSGEPDPASYI